MSDNDAGGISPYGPGMGHAVASHDNSAAVVLRLLDVATQMGGTVSPLAARGWVFTVSGSDTTRGYPVAIRAHRRGAPSVLN